MLIAQVAIPRPHVSSTWDYLIPGDLAESAKVGSRVSVPLGSGISTGYITSISQKPHTSKNLKIVTALLDSEPLISKELLELTRWTAEYYLASWGDLIKASLPAGINPPEKQLLQISNRGRKQLKLYAEKVLLNENEADRASLLSYLVENGPLALKDLQKDFSGSDITKTKADDLIEFRHPRSGMKLKKTVRALSLADLLPENADEIISKSNARKLIVEYLKSKSEPVITAKVIDKVGVSRSVLTGLVKSGILIDSLVEDRRNPFKHLDIEHIDPFPLTAKQEGIFQPVADSLDKGKYETFLLHGITGSGKTEIYLHLINKALQSNKTALILIPELSLTPQFVKRYYAAFGEDLAILHSGLPPGARVDEWRRVREGKAKIVLGTRLSIFAPLENLGLIIVDEEHDQSYKQDDYPVFSARDLAIVRSGMNNATCLLGSATPSLESLYNAEKGKYKLLELQERVFNRPLPKVTLVDLRKPENRPVKNHLVPETVIEAIDATIKRGEQALVMVGRKGYSPFVLCRSCGESFECKHCSISTSWHDDIGKLKCHYCGRSYQKPALCPKCGSSSIASLGTGTAKVEANLRDLFPKANIGRMDRDVITKHAQYQQILDQVSSGELDILVGTQMLAKGHDYHGITTVVAMGMDNILNLPDFRHSERLFQLILQISGRAGRGENVGEVFILSYRTDHYAIQGAATGDWDSFLGREMAYRSSLRYPPFGYMALLVTEDFNRERSLSTARSVSELLFEKLEGKAFILGPSLAPYARLKNRWRHQVLIKAGDRKLLNSALAATKNEIKGQSQVKITVDPFSVM